MKTIWRTLVRWSLLVLLVAGTTVAVSGCERKKDLGNRVEDTADKAGKAIERAGDKAENAL